MSTFYVTIDSNNYIYLDCKEDKDILQFEEIDDNIYLANLEPGTCKTYKITLDLEDSNDDLCFMIFNCDCNKSVEINTPLYFYKKMSECTEWLNDGFEKYDLKKTITCYYQKCANYEISIYSLCDYLEKNWKSENRNESKITDNSFTLMRFYQ
jgi:hypothetical protein